MQLFHFVVLLAALDIHVSANNTTLRALRRQEHGLKIIGAGQGTSGTRSLWRVLCSMGFNAHHWVYICGDPAHPRGITSPVQSLHSIYKSLGEKGSAEDLNDYVSKYHDALIEDIRILKSNEASLYCII